MLLLDQGSNICCLAYKQACPGFVHLVLRLWWCCVMKLPHDQTLYGLMQYIYGLCDTTVIADSGCTILVRV